MIEENLLRYSRDQNESLHHLCLPIRGMVGWNNRIILSIPIYRIRMQREVINCHLDVYAFTLWRYDCTVNVANVRQYDGVGSTGCSVTGVSTRKLILPCERMC